MVSDNASQDRNKDIDDALTDHQHETCEGEELQLE